MHARAGQPSDREQWIDVDALLAAYHDVRPDPADPAQQVAFGTSGHRGSAQQASFNETHILAVTQAICDYRRHARIGGPLYLGKDTHALSRPAEHTALEVLAANGIVVIRQPDDGVAPTPVISRAIVAHNRGRVADDPGRADGVVVTPSHNPPEDGGFKYNPPGGGPADTDVTGWIQDRANALITAGLDGVRRIDYTQACAATTTRDEDFVAPYVAALAEAIDFDVIRAAGLRIGIDPLGGSSLPYVQALGAAYGIDVTVVNPELDPRFAFMTLDHDGRIRMDCSSPHAMASLIALKDEFDVAFGIGPGRRPPRDRRPVLRPAESQPLPGRRDPLPGRRAPRLARGSPNREDARQQRHPRPGGEAPGAGDLRGPRRLQVVRPGPGRRQPPLRRRGERGGELPPPGRHGLDHRQGRDPARAPGGRADRAHRPGSGRPLRGDRRGARPPPLPPRGPARHARGRSRASPPSRRTTCGARRSPASPSSPA